VTAINNTPSSNPNKTKIQLFNNPSSYNRFQFKSDQFYQKLQWQIIDEMGRILQEGSLHLVLKSSIQSVSTQPLNKGIYFIRFLGDNKIQQTLTWIKE
ncbi:MAG: T9SS type A sorting domain-containing protein, partial [Sediminibacterium sp.]